ncbi:MAG: type II toxin-antitoxin system HicB family antitoxin [Deltaproteobacteria bacterium]|nr:type II toxin-antitoxin system HicB family antitoxin [Deltaproteobacteria bacterium]
MQQSGPMPRYSYHITWSPEDRQFVATFLELPGLSGLGDTIAEAIKELNEALHGWFEAAQKENFELPEPSMQAPCVIVDARFMGEDPYVTELVKVLPEEFLPEGEVGQTVLGPTKNYSKVIKIRRTGQVVEL